MSFHRSKRIWAALWLCAGLSAQSYSISTLAGGGPPPTPAQGTTAALGQTWGVATDTLGNVYFTTLNCVFKLDTSGVMTRLAGTSFVGFSGDGGPAISAQLSTPIGLAVDQAGNVFVADAGNQRIRKISTNGMISSVAGGGTITFPASDGGQATKAQ